MFCASYILLSGVYPLVVNLTTHSVAQIMHRAVQNSSPVLNKAVRKVI